MFGRKLNKMVTNELERRKRAMDRTNFYASRERSYFDASFESRKVNDVLLPPEYGLHEMMMKTTYSRLISPMFTRPDGGLHEIHGRLLASSALSEDGTAFVPNENYENTYWNTTGDQRGYIPPPGITSIRTAYAGEGATINTIKEADITLRLFSLDQYNLIVPYFVRIGTILYLEYGWSNPKIELEKLQAYPRQFLTISTNSDGLPVVTMNLDEVQKFPDEFAINTRGNSDVFVGTVTNYDAKMQQDGGFEINISMKTTGHSMYNLPTYSDERANIKLVKNTTNPQDDPFNHNLDERTAPIMLAKAKLIIQDDFDILDVFKTNIDNDDFFSQGRSELIGFEQPSFYYVKDSTAGMNAIKDIKGQLSNKGFHVHPGHLIPNSTYNPQKDLVAIHQSQDLVLTVTQVGKHEITLGVMTDGKDEKQKDEKEKYFGYKINYYPSIRYIEDNLLSRLFGVVKEDGKITAGIRSIHIPKSSYELGLDNVILPYKSNKMLTHRLLVPKNFNQILVNTEAMSAMLQRTGTGLFKSEGKILGSKDTSASGYAHLEYANFSKALGEQLNKYGLPFIDETEPPKDSETADDSDQVTNPNHVPASMRHMYVNIELVQESFLGSANVNFCNRNYFPSTGDTIEVKDGDDIKVVARNQILDRDIVTKNEIYTYFQDVGVRFDKEACAKTLREGLYNMWNSISANFHNFPNFEVGGNINLPNFLQVYDLRFTKANEFYEFDVFNKDSIIKSLEFNSQVPTTVQLAATFGASTSFDFDSLLGGINNGLKEDLAIDLIKQNNFTKGRNNILNAISFEKSAYLERLTAFQYKDKAMLLDEAGVKQGKDTLARQAELLGINLPKVYGQPVKQANGTSGGTAATPIKDVPGADLPSLTLNDLYLERGDASSYPFYGIAPELVAGSKAAIEEDNRDKDEVVRKYYPDLNKQFVQMQDALNKLFLLNNKGEALYNKVNKQEKAVESKNKVKQKVPDENGELVVEEVDVSVNLATGVIEGLIKDDKTVSFTTTYANFTNSVPGQRGATIIEFGTHADYQGYLDYLIYQDESQSLKALNGTISYFELSFQIDGIAGILPGEAFTISYLPDLIKDYFYFIVKNVEQECTSDGWTTTITALQRRKYFVAKDRQTLPIALSNLSDSKPQNKKPIDIKSMLPPSDNRPLPGTLERDIADVQATFPEDIAPVDTDQSSDTLSLDDVKKKDTSGIAQIPDSSKAIVDRTGRGGFGPVGNTKTNLSIGKEFPLRPIPKFTPKPLPVVEEPPKPKRNFVAYDVADSPTAEITLAFTNGQAQVVTSPAPEDQQQLVKVFPEGDKDNKPLAFTLGVTDILSQKEYDEIINTYIKAFPDRVTGGHTGKNIFDMMRQMYEPLTIRDRNYDKREEPGFGSSPLQTGELKDKDFGKWDTQTEISFYVAKKDISEGISVRTYIEEMMKQATVIGKDDTDRENASTDSVANQSYVDDIIYRILSQPQRTRINVLEIQEEDDEVEVKVDESEVVQLETETTGSGDIVLEENESGGKEKEEELTPQEPILSTYQSYKLGKQYPDGAAYLQNSKYLYKLCQGWRPGKSRKNTIFYPQEKYPNETKVETKHGPVPFTLRRKFWDEMIEPPNKGGVYDESFVAKRVAELMEREEFKKPMVPGQTWVAINDIPKNYDPANNKLADEFYDKFQASGDIFTTLEKRANE